MQQAIEIRARARQLRQYKVQDPGPLRCMNPLADDISDMLDSRTARSAYRQGLQVIATNFQAELIDLKWRTEVKTSGLVAEHKAEVDALVAKQKQKEAAMNAQRPLTEEERCIAAVELQRRIDARTRAAREAQEVAISQYKEEKRALHKKYADWRWWHGMTCLASAQADAKKQARKAAMPPFILDAQNSVELDNMMQYGLQSITPDSIGSHPTPMLRSHTPASPSAAHDLMALMRNGDVNPLCYDNPYSRPAGYLNDRTAFSAGQHNDSYSQMLVEAMYKNDTRSRAPTPTAFDIQQLNLARPHQPTNYQNNTLSPEMQHYQELLTQMSRQGAALSSVHQAATTQQPRHERTVAGAMAQEHAHAHDVNTINQLFRAAFSHSDKIQQMM